MGGYRRMLGEYISPGELIAELDDENSPYHATIIRGDSKGYIDELVSQLESRDDVYLVVANDNDDLPKQVQRLYERMSAAGELGDVKLELFFRLWDAFGYVCSRIKMNARKLVIVIRKADAGEQLQILAHEFQTQYGLGIDVSMILAGTDAGIDELINAPTTTFLYRSARINLTE